MIEEIQTMLTVLILTWPRLYTTDGWYAPIIGEIRVLPPTHTHTHIARTTNQPSNNNNRKEEPKSHQMRKKNL